MQVSPDKAVSEAGGVSPLYEQLTSLQPRQELMAEYLWPRPPHYHLLWPGRPLPSLPVTKEAAPAPGPGLRDEDGGCGDQDPHTALHTCCLMIQYPVSMYTN